MTSCSIVSSCNGLLGNHEGGGAQGRAGGAPQGGLSSCSFMVGEMSWSHRDGRLVIVTGVAQISKDLTQGQEIVSAQQGGGLDEDRTWFKRAGHRPAAQEGGGEKTEGPLFPLRRTLDSRRLLSHFMGSLGRVPAKRNGMDTGPHSWFPDTMCWTGPAAATGWVAGLFVGTAARS